MNLGGRQQLADLESPSLRFTGRALSGSARGTPGLAGNARAALADHLTPVVYYTPSRADVRPAHGQGGQGANLRPSVTGA